MFIAPKNTDLLLVEAVGESLYLKLSSNKQVSTLLTNRFSMSVTPEDQNTITRKIFRLIQYKFAEYLIFIHRCI
jgi:hypothetical protein